eukprot:TRINITY_DN424_c0_g1_i1.p1 TRINITY_DN424_c0_g1~~TRINITY_DN424_c0_g1_i1.p1  ORF type:complete len:537 (+),score=138.81 TRINITY_DN424_c0_g1_i1:1054-2664(+)
MATRGGAEGGSAKMGPSSEPTIQAVRIQDKYRFGKKLGAGQFGTTYECQEKASGKLACCKAIPKSKLVSMEDVNDVKREVAILHHVVGHENIVDIYGAFEDRENVYIVMELCRGGDLYETILERMERNGGTPYSERDAAALAKTILKVVEQCHALGVIHRDLKPENFLISSRGPDGILKATDFGLSAFFRPGDGFERHCGSPMYMAPEVVRWKPGAWTRLTKPPRYGCEVDIWSAGVIIYALLSGYPPFYAKSHSSRDIFKAILRGNPSFSTPPWPAISKDAKDLLRWMLDPDPKKRPTAFQVISHPWISEDGVAKEEPLDPVVATRLKEFTSMCKLKRVATAVIADSLQEEEIAGLKEMFKMMDADGSGTITLQELKEGLIKIGARVTEAELNRIMSETDIDHSGMIEYREFLAATLHLSKITKQENLHKAFAHFDKDGSGSITEDELVEACKTLNIGKQEVEQMIKEVDSNADGKIDYNEFVSMMGKSSSSSGGRRSRGVGSLASTSDLTSTSSLSEDSDLDGGSLRRFLPKRL